MGSDQTLAEWLRETEDQLYGVTRGHEAADYLEKLEADLEVATMKRVRDTDRIEKLEAALDDALQYVSRADWHYLKDETRKTLEGKDD